MLGTYLFGYIIYVLFIGYNLYTLAKTINTTVKPLTDTSNQRIPLNNGQNLQSWHSPLELLKCRHILITDADKFRYKLSQSDKLKYFTLKITLIY